MHMKFWTSGKYDLTPVVAVMMNWCISNSEPKKKLYLPEKIITIIMRDLTEQTIKVI